MNMPARVSTAWTLMASFSLLMGWVLAQGLAFHQPRHVPSDWGEARWIGLETAQEKLYLRRNVVLGTQPRSARLSVAGSDHFELFVNGGLIGREDYLGERPSTTYDLTRVLRPGLNTIAIEVTRSSKRRPAQAIALLEWHEGNGLRRVASDSSWRAESRRVLAGAGAVDWSASAYADAAWPFARVYEQAAGGDLPQPASLDRVLFEPSQARWIWHGNPQSAVGAFARELRLDAASVSTGWLGVSVDGVYMVAVNGFVLEPLSGSGTRMDVFDIAPYLRRGDNRVELHVSGGQPPMRLAVIGHVVTDQGPADFSSDTRWHQSPGGEPVTVLGRFESQRPALTAVRLQPTQAWRRAQAGRWLAASGLIAASLLAIGLLLTRHHEPVLRPQAWMRQAQPWAAAALLLGAALLADLDTRVRLAPYYGFWLPAAALLLAALVALWVARQKTSLRSQHEQ